MRGCGGVIFSNMAKWLSAPDAAALLGEFACEMDRRSGPASQLAVATNFASVPAERDQGTEEGSVHPSVQHRGYWLKRLATPLIMAMSHLLSPAISSKPHSSATSASHSR